MTQIKIVTDSSCGVTDEEIKKYNISIVPLSVMIDDTVYVERETISDEDLCYKLFYLCPLKTHFYDATENCHRVYHYDG